MIGYINHLYCAYLVLHNADVGRRPLCTEDSRSQCCKAARY